MGNKTDELRETARALRAEFEAVTQARASAQAAKSVEEQAQAENALTAALGRRHTLLPVTAFRVSRSAAVTA